MAAVALVSHSQFTVAHANPLGLLFLPVPLGAWPWISWRIRSLSGFFRHPIDTGNLSVGFIDGVTFPLCHPILRVGPTGP